MSGKSAIAMCSRPLGLMCGCLPTYLSFSKNLTLGHNLFNVNGLGRIQRMSRFTVRNNQPQNSHVRKVCGVKLKERRTLNMADNLIRKQQNTKHVVNKKSLLKKQRDLQVLAMIQEILCRKQVNRNIIMRQKERAKPLNVHAKSQRKNEQHEEPVKKEIFFRTHNIVKPEELKPEEVKPEVLKPEKLKMEEKNQSAWETLLVMDQTEENATRDTPLCAKQYEESTREEITCEKPMASNFVHKPEEALCTKETEYKPDDEQNQKETEPLQTFESIFYTKKSAQTAPNDATFCAKEKAELPRGLVEKFFNRMHTDMFKTIFFRPHKKT